jgi:hypothetical protein
MSQFNDTVDFARAAVFDVEGGMVQGRRLADMSRHRCVYLRHHWVVPSEKLLGI